MNTTCNSSSFAVISHFRLAGKVLLLTKFVWLKPRISFNVVTIVLILHHAVDDGTLLEIANTSNLPYFFY